MDAENWACSRSMRGILPDSVCWFRLGQNFWAHSRFVSELGQLVTLSISHIVDTGKFLNIWYYKIDHDHSHKVSSPISALYWQVFSSNMHIKQWSRDSPDMVFLTIASEYLYWIYTEYIYTEYQILYILKHMPLLNIELSLIPLLLLP